MAEYVNDKIKIIGIGDNVGIDIPKPIASINFDARYAGTYVVDVKQDGSYSAVFVGSMHEVEKWYANNRCEHRLL